MGRRSARSVRYSPGDSARSKGQQRSLLRYGHDALFDEDTHFGHCRRPAGRSFRTALRRAGHVQDDLRNGLLRDDEYRQPAGFFQKRDADYDRMEDRGANNLCARGERLRRRSRDSMAARRLGNRPLGARDRRVGAVGRRQRRSLFRSGPDGPGRALLGSVRAGTSGRSDPRNDEGPYSPCGARGHRFRGVRRDPGHGARRDAALDGNESGRGSRGEQFPDAVPVRPDARRSRPAEDSGNDGDGSGLSGRAGRRLLEGYGGDRPLRRGRATLRARNAAVRGRAQDRALA